MKKLKVLISVFGTFNVSENLVKMDIPEQSSLKALISEFAFTLLTDPELLLDKDGNVRRHLIIQVNKSRVLAGRAETHILKEGDEVCVYPSVSGG